MNRELKEMWRQFKEMVTYAPIVILVLALIALITYLDYLAYSYRFPDAPWWTYLFK